MSWTSGGTKPGRGVSRERASLGGSALSDLERPGRSRTALSRLVGGSAAAGAVAALHRDSPSRCSRRAFYEAAVHNVLQIKELGRRDGLKASNRAAGEQT